MRRVTPIGIAVAVVLALVAGALQYSRRSVAPESSAPARDGVQSTPTLAAHPRSRKAPGSAMDGDRSKGGAPSKPDRATTLASITVRVHIDESPVAGATVRVRPYEELSPTVIGTTNSEGLAQLGGLAQLDGGASSSFVVEAMADGFRVQTDLSSRSQDTFAPKNLLVCTSGRDGAV